MTKQHNHGKNLNNKSLPHYCPISFVSVCQHMPLCSLPASLRTAQSSSAIATTGLALWSHTKMSWIIWHNSPGHKPCKKLPFQNANANLKRDCIDKIAVLLNLTSHSNRCSNNKEEQTQNQQEQQQPLGQGQGRGTQHDEGSGDNIAVQAAQNGNPLQQSSFPYTCISYCRL